MFLENFYTYITRIFDIFHNLSFTW